MDRADRAGWGAAVAGHVLVFGALSLGLIAAPKPPLPATPAVDVQIVDEVSVKDQVPNPSPAAPAPSVAPDVGPPVEEAPPPPPEPTVAPAPKVQPAPLPVTPKPRPAPVAKPKALAVATPMPAPLRRAPAKPVAARPILSRTAFAQPALKPPHGARLGTDFLKGIADHPSTATGQAPRAPVGALATASIGRLVREQLKPYWKAPTGADAELLRTELSISLGADGSVKNVHVIRTTGQTDSNRAQVKLHQEAALKAVRLAAPFALPPDLYDAWKLLEPVSFDKRMG